MIAEVIVDIALSETDKVYDYEALENTVLGQRVCVPFGRQVIEGVVIGLKETTDYPKKLKKIIRPLDNFVAIQPEMLELMRYFSIHNNLRYIDLLRLFIPSELRGGKVKSRIVDYCGLVDGMTAEEILDLLSNRAVRQRECIEYLAEKCEYKTVLNKKFGASAVNALIDRGLVVVKEVEKRRIPDATKYNVKKPILNSDQQKAVDEICSAHGAYLLHGVTGSGKTEVYMHCIENALKQGKTAIMLVPEISLTPQIFGLFRARFGDKVAILHSGLSQGERYDEWRRLLLGKASIAVGARSAIFAPLTNVGMIIVDEEHDSSYISESNPRYDTREIAEFRAKYNKAPLVLGSATPSVETYYKTETNEYKLLELPHRVHNLLMPKMEIVNMSDELRMGNRDIFSVDLSDALKATIEKKEQVLIFINRRGFASFVMCRDCGYIAKCKDCDISLTYHREDNQLKCHYCGKRYHMLTECPICHSKNIKNGRVGTERVVDEIHKIVPDAKVIRMDNDTTSRKGAHQRILEKFLSGDADVLVGTQMIAKGHDFKNVSLVGILDADFSLYFSDYRSNERTFQLITQVAGRAGRQTDNGRVIIQTYTPRHYVFRYVTNYDFKGFYDKEKNSRQVTKFPPFSVIVRILVTSLKDQQAMDITREINEQMKGLIRQHKSDFIYYKGARAPITRIKRRYRYQLMMRLDNKNFDKIIQKIYNITNKFKKEKDSWVFVEISPQTLI